MKWIAVILVMLNVAAYLIGLKLDPDAEILVSSAPFEAVNEAKMSVIKPESRINPAAMELEAAAPELLEDPLTRLKIDNRGEVLTTQKPSAKKSLAQNNSATGVVKPELSAAPLPVPIIRAEPNPILQPRTESPKKPVIVAAQPAPDVEPKPAPRPALKPVPKPVPKPVQPVQKTPEKVVAAPVTRSQRESLVCYRVGPFGDKVELTAVRRKLKSKSIDFKLEEKTLPGDVKGARVYVGGFSDAVALDQEKQRLKELSVDNYEVTLNGDAVLQLGYFTSANGASKAQKMLKAKGIDAKIYTIYKSTQIESWLTLAAAQRDAVTSLALPKGVKAKERSCP